jgi:hypothetical protein
LQLDPHLLIDHGDPPGNRFDDCPAVFIANVISPTARKRLRF